MDESSKVSLAVITLVAAGALLAFGALLVSLVNNLSPPPTTLISLGAFELCVAGAVVLPIGYAGLARNMFGIKRLAAQAGGLLLGGIIFSGGVYWEAVASSSGIYLLTLYAVTAVILSGLAIFCLALNAILGYSAVPVQGSSVPNAAAAGGQIPATSPIPPESQFCPFCGSPMSVGHQFCRKCGRPVASQA
jgi:hypothetical protein